MKRKALALTIVFLLICSSYPNYTLKTEASSNVIIVPQDYPTIQEAVNAASSGAIIYVKAGTYYENVGMNKDNLTLIGEDKDTTIIDGKRWDLPIHIAASNIKLTGFTLRNSYPSAAYSGIRVSRSSNCFIYDNHVINNQGGIDVSSSSNILIYNNNVTANGHRAIWIYFSSNISIYNNYIADNTWEGVDISYSSNSSIYGNTIKNNDIGIEVYYSRDNKIFHNNLISNNKQAYVYKSYNNVWDDGYPSGGNYWDDYMGSDANNDGIGETPYIIDWDNKDRYPLIKPWRLALAPDFRIAASPSTQTINPGQTAEFNVNVTSINGFSLPVSFSGSITSGTTEISLTFNPQIVTPPSDGSMQSTLTVSTTSTVGTGTYTLRIIGISEEKTHLTSVNLIITSPPKPPTDFNITVLPSTQTIKPNQSTNYIINVTSINGFSLPVSLSGSISPSTSDISLVFDPQTVTPPSDGSVESTLTVSTTSTVAPATYNITINGTSGTLTRSYNATLLIQPIPERDFGISVIPTSQTIFQGKSKTFTITTMSMNGFNSPVTFSGSVEPSTSEITLKFDPEIVTPPTDGSVQSTLTVSATSTVAIGTYAITIRGTSGEKTKSTDVTLTIISSTEPNFDIEISPLSQSVNLGDTVEYTITFTSINNFASSIALSYSIDPNPGGDTRVLVMFFPESVSLPAGGQVQSKLYVSPTILAKPDTYRLTITGIGDGLTQAAMTSAVISIPNSITVSHDELGYLKLGDGYYAGFYVTINLEPTSSTALKDITIKITLDNPAIFVGDGATKITEAPFVEDAILKKRLDVLTLAMFFIAGKALGTIVEIPLEIKVLSTLNDLNELMKNLNEIEQLQAALKDPYDSLSLEIDIPSSAYVLYPGSHITFYILTKSIVPLNDKYATVDVNALLYHPYAEGLGTLPISASHSIHLYNPDWPEKIDSLVFIGESPVNLLVVDPQGKRIGFDADKGQSLNEISYAAYSGADTKPQIVSIPSWVDGIYRLIVYGKESGEYNLSILSIGKSQIEIKFTASKTIEKSEKQEFTLNISSEGNVTQATAAIPLQYVVAVIVIAIAALTITFVTILRRKRRVPLVN